MDPKLENILNKLKDLYPQYKITFKLKKSLYILTINDKNIYEFNPDIILKDVEFLQNNKEYENFLLQLFIDPIEQYHKKTHPTRHTRGKNSIGLTLQEIQEAINNTRSNSEAARFCHVSYTTYKKYAKKYSKWEEHLAVRGKGAGSPKLFLQISGRRYTEEDIINGNIPNTYSSYRLKERLLTMNMLKEECAICGFHEKRITDQKVPLLLDYIDGMTDNRKLENIRLLCFNCYYLYVGTPWWRKKGDQKIKLEKEYSLIQDQQIKK